MQPSRPRRSAASILCFYSDRENIRRLRDNEFPQAEPDKIEVIPVTPGMSIERLAKTTPIKKYPVERLRLLNDLYPDKEPVPGEKIKIVALGRS